MKRNLWILAVVILAVAMVSVGVVNANNCPNLTVATSLSPPTSQMSEFTAGTIAFSSVSATDLTATTIETVEVAYSIADLTTNFDVAMGIGAPRKTFMVGASSFSCVVAYNLGTLISVAVLSNGDGDSFSNRNGMIDRDGLIALTSSQTDMQAWLGAPRKFVSTANSVSGLAVTRDDICRGATMIATETARSARDCVIINTEGMRTGTCQVNSQSSTIIEENTIATRPTRTNLRWV